MKTKNKHFTGRASDKKFFYVSWTNDYETLKNTIWKDIPGALLLTWINVKLSMDK